MKKTFVSILFVISVLVFIGAIVGLDKFEEYVNQSEGAYREYKYTESSNNDDVNVYVETTESWPKELPEDFELDEHFSADEYSRINEAGTRECNGRTIEVTIDNLSEYRINKWDIVYKVPCDMYFDKAWNGTVEIHQFGGENVDTISTKDMPVANTSLTVYPVDELFLIPLKKGDTIIYHPIDFEYPLVESFANDENSSKKIGFIMYTEDDTFKLNNFTLRYYIVQSLEDYAMYNVLIALEMIFGLMSLASLIYLFISIRYEKMHKHDMEIISQAIGTFSKFIDSKDRYTNNHSYRVAEYARLIAKKLHMTGRECEDIYYIGLLHDTGKVVIDDGILNKPGKLTNEEYEIIKSHTVKGAEMLKEFTAIKDISVGAMYHHERYDGKGYPSGIEGEAIPLVARIIAVADAYDAMSSNRCYRAQLESDEITEQLVINKGKQFDPAIVDVFLECIKNGETDSIRRSCIES